MLEYRFPGYLPSAEDLPDSDETPVDNELQELIPALLKSILLMIWEQRMDWLFAIDMGIYTEQRVEELTQRLRALGIDPDSL